MRKPLAYSFAVEFAVMLSIMAGFRIASDNWGEAGFGEWALTRRVLSFIVPVVMCGIDIAIPRFVAASAATAHAHGAIGYFDGGMLIVGAGLGVATLLLLCFGETAALVLFGDVTQLPLVMPLWALVFAYCVYLPSYAYLRGTMRIMDANFCHLVMYGVLPLIALTLVTEGAAPALLAMAGLSFLFALGCIGSLRFAQPSSSAGLYATVRQLIAYGMPRMYASFGLMTLVTLPPVVVAHRDGIAAAGLVAFAVMLVGVSGSAVTPIGVSVLPYASRAAASGDTAALRRAYRKVQLAVVAISVGIAGPLLLFAPFATRLFLGVSDDHATDLVRIAALAIMPYVYFVSIRNLLEAMAVRSIATRAVALALLTFAVAAVALLGIADLDAARGVLWAYAASLVVLALQAAVAVRGLMIASSQTRHEA